MNQKFYFTLSILHLFINCISTDTTPNRSDWWKEVSHNSSPNNTEYVSNRSIQSLINSTISGNEYWHTNQDNYLQRLNRSDTLHNEIAPPEIILAANRNANGSTKIIRKIKRTFKTVKPSEEMISEWKENIANIVEPSITLDRNSPAFTTTSSPISTLEKASTTNLIQSTASDIDNLITSRVKWDDLRDDDETILPLSRSNIFKAKTNNQDNNYERYASIMPLPPPDTQPIKPPTTVSSSIGNQQYGNENSNNLQSSSHHSVVAPLSSSNNNFFNFNSKIVHNQPASRSNEGNNKNQRKKQTRNVNSKSQKNKVKQPAQDFFLEADKIDKKVDDHHVNVKKTVDFTSRVNHEVTPKNNFLAHLLKNNPFAIPLGKKTYKVTNKKTTTVAAPPSTILSKRMQPVRYASSTGLSSSRSSGDDITTTPMSILSNDNLDNINFKATPSKQEYTWGRRVQASNNLISKTNAKANQQLAKRNEWSDNDEQKDSINNKLLENNESDEESVENDENTNEDVETINNDLNDEFNKNLAAIRNEESPKLDVVTFKTPTSKSPGTANQGKSNSVKSLPIQIISWRQAVIHRQKGKETVSEEKPFAGERLTSAKLTVSNRVTRKEQQVEREKPVPKAFSAKPQQQTTKQPATSSNPKSSTFKTTAAPKQTSTTKASYNNAPTTSNDVQSPKRQSVAKSTRSPLNSFVAGRKNEAYVAPQSTSKTKPAQLFQEYEDEKDNFREELDDNFISRQVDSHSSPKKENRVKYTKNQEFRKKSLNLIEDKNQDNSIENNDQTEATKPIPHTSFKCTEPGYFGDVEVGCTVFHICQENNRKDSFFCPPGTAFNQMLSVCDWQANVNCEASTRSRPITSSNLPANSNNAFENNLRNNN